MNFAFRTDASKKIGGGHVSRCLNLARELRAQGNKCVFILRRQTGSLIEKIKKDNFEINILKNERNFKNKNLKISNTSYQNWLGVSWEVDAAQTCNILKEKEIDWLVIDHYGIDKLWEKKLRPYTKKIMVIDDLANRSHDCDLLLDQNLIANFKNRYNKIIPKYCNTLLGPKYSLLQKEYENLHLSTPTRIGPVKNILVYFGATDQIKIIKMTTSAFLNLNRKDISLNIVISSNIKSKDVEDLKKLSKKNNNIKLHNESTSLAYLILKADLAIGACGTTSWERCCLGLPSIVITIADNQIPIAKELDKKQLILWLGHYQQVKRKNIEKSLRNFIDQNLEQWSSKCKQLTDGKGVKLVASILTLNANTKIYSRLAQLKDANLFEDDFGKFIKNNKHNLFYSKLRSQETSKIYIIETKDGLPLSKVEFTLINNVWEINCEQKIYVKNLKLKNFFISHAIYKFRLDQDKLLIFSKKNKYKSFRKKELSISFCTERNSWLNKFASSFLLEMVKKGHQCSWVHNAEELKKGDICFYLSYEHIVKKEILKKFRNNLVVHASDLPNGKGWSPLTWQILDGKKKIHVSLIEADEKVDSGKIYKKLQTKFNGFELLDELRFSVTDVTFKLCRNFVEKFPQSLKKAKPQNGKETFYPRRFKKDSKLDLNKSILEQFNLFRVVDNDRYPAFFELNGSKYYLMIKAEKKF